MGLWDDVKGAASGAKNAVVGGVTKGAAAIKSKAKDMAAQAAALAFFAAIAAAAFVIYRNPSYRNYIIGGLTFSRTAPMSQKIIVWGGILLIIGVMYMIRAYSSKYKRLAYFDPISKVEGLYGGMKSSADVLGIFEGFETQESSTSNATLLTSQPMTLDNAGLSSESTYDPSVAVLNALQAGFRSFILYVDYKDAEPDTPLLVYRTPDGALLATGDIMEFSNVIKTSAFRADANVPNSSQPIIVYLHVLRSPSPVDKPEGYKNFLGKIAMALNPLAPNHLGSNPLGKFNRQAQEETLLTTPLSSFGQSVIILSNADTTSTRNTSDPSKDLDFYINMRVWLDGDKALGISQPFSGAGAASAIVTTMPSIEALDSTARVTFASKGKSRFVIALPDKVNPTPDLLTSTLKLGVNMIGINMILETPESAKVIGATYNNVPWITKPTHLT
jgi:hypothetical protein